MKVAVVGQIEWGRFARAARIPGVGEVVDAAEAWEEVAGGGAVAAMQLAALNGECAFFTAVGDDDPGRRALAQLQARNVEVFAAVRDTQPTRTSMVLVDESKERTIVIAGDTKPRGVDPLPWGRLATMDAVYFACGDAEALRRARKAKVLVSTARILPLLQEEPVRLEALLASGHDADEVYREGDLSPAPEVVITTYGVKGGVVSTGQRYSAEPVSTSDIVDTVGCGDAFAAGVTYGLGRGGMDMEGALQIAARAGADAVRRRGAFGN